MKKIKPNKEKTKPKIEESRYMVFPDKPILHLTIKMFILLVIIGSFIQYSDIKGFFNPDQSNNHTKKKWDAFYEFTKDNNVDILLLGNSHLYTGINPKNLSAALGVNSFILASPGTNISDTYFSLKEALKKTEAKLVVIETFGINNFNPYHLNKGSLSDQLKSFYARKDFLTKLASTPFLFTSDNYPYAWSNTIRNHDYLFQDTTQLAKNRFLMKAEKKKNKKLYLGRYVRFQKGIDNKLISKYDSLGAPVSGNDYMLGHYSEKYIDKIVELCKQEKVELIFLTLPMYYKHISNFEVWNKKLQNLLGKYPNKWLNLQMPYDTLKYTPKCFENTYKENQHMTYSGSLIATYQLVDFIKTETSVQFPNRKSEKKWTNNFYGQEGYFENNPVSKNDKTNKILCKNMHTNGFILKEVSLLKNKNSKNKILIAKIDKRNRNLDYRKTKLRLAISYIDKNETKVASVDLQYDIFHELSNVAVFKVKTPDIEITQVKGGAILSYKY